MKTTITFLLVLISAIGLSQTKVSGKVVDEKNHPIVGANVYIEGTYDGASTDENGAFIFETSEKGHTRFQ